MSQALHQRLEKLLSMSGGCPHVNAYTDSKAVFT